MIIVGNLHYNLLISTNVVWETIRDAKLDLVGGRSKSHRIVYLCCKLAWETIVVWMYPSRIDLDLDSTISFHSVT